MVTRPRMRVKTWSTCAILLTCAACLACTAHALGEAGSPAAAKAETDPVKRLKRSKARIRSRKLAAAGGADLADVAAGEVRSASRRAKPAAELSDAGDAADDAAVADEDETPAAEAADSTKSTARGASKLTTPPDDEPTSSSTPSKKAELPLFSFPRQPGQGHTAAEAGLQDSLPLQQRLVKYFTDDKVFAVQVAGSACFLANAALYALRSHSSEQGGSSSLTAHYQCALLSVAIKQWCTVLQRMKRVLVPHLLYEPSKYSKFRGRVTALARDPAIQTLVYCALFLPGPHLGLALAPLLLREAVYLLLVLGQVLSLALPRAAAACAFVLQWPLAVLVSAGDIKAWKRLQGEEKQVAVGRKVAQACVKLEIMVLAAVLLRQFPRGMAGSNKVC
jgi:hypothetical protein